MHRITRGIRSSIMFLVTTMASLMRIPVSLYMGIPVTTMTSLMLSPVSLYMGIPVTTMTSLMLSPVSLCMGIPVTILPSLIFSPASLVIMGIPVMFSVPTARRFSVLLCRLRPRPRLLSLKQTSPL